MSNTFVVLWSQERCRKAQEEQGEGCRLELLFGGPHLSQPSLHKYRIQSGDVVYPVAVFNEVLYLLGCLKVTRLLSVEAYLAEHPRQFAPYRDQSGAGLTLRAWAEAERKTHLVWTCTDDVAEGAGTALRFDMPVPGDMLERLRFCTRKGEQPLKHVESGRLRSVLALQGVYRKLCPASARDFADLLTARQTEERKRTTHTGGAEGQQSFEALLEEKEP